MLNSASLRTTKGDSSMEEERNHKMSADRDESLWRWTLLLHDDLEERRRYGSRHTEERQQIFEAWLKKHGLTEEEVKRKKERLQEVGKPSPVQRFFRSAGDMLINTIPFALFGAFLAAAGVPWRALVLLFLSFLAADWRIESVFRQCRESLEMKTERFARETYRLREDTSDLLARSEPPSSRG